MKIVRDINEANDLFQSYLGAVLQIAFYSESLKRIAIRISLPYIEEVIYFVGVGCENIHGRFKLSNVNLVVSYEVDQKTKENIIRLSDKKLGFNLDTSGGFSLAQGLESEFGTSFDNFLTEDS